MAVTTVKNKYMSELVFHHAHNPDSRKSRLLVREGGTKPHKLRLNGKRSIGFVEDGNSVKLYQLYNMQVIGNPDGLDISLVPVDLRLRPGQQVTLRFDRGRVLHTVSCLPPDVNGAAVKAIQRAKVTGVR